MTDILKEQGSSGAWIVSGTLLLGVTIAVYDHEPYARMLPISSVSSDIRALYRLEFMCRKCLFGHTQYQVRRTATTEAMRT